MAFIGDFKRDSLPKGEGFTPVPAGWYIVTISGSEVKETKDGTGTYIKLVLDIQGPSHAGRKIFSNINIRNKSPDAERIGLQQLREIMEAGGLDDVTDSDQLIGVTLEAKVAVKPASGDYEAGNEIKGYRGIEKGEVINLPRPSASPAPKQEAPWAAKKPGFMQ